MISDTTTQQQVHHKTMMEGVSNHDDAGTSSSNDANGNIVEGNTRQDQVGQRQQQTSEAGLLAACSGGGAGSHYDYNDTSTHATSVAAMSTDDVSSMGDTYYTGTNSAASYHRRNSNKRKDDCSESRCTVTSEESARSRRRRCRSQQRWLDRIDRKAATSHAPIRPNRSDDDSFLLPPPPPVGAGGDCSVGGDGAAAAAPRSREEAGLTAESGSTFAFHKRSVSHSLPSRPSGTEHFFHSFSNLTSSQADITSTTARRRGNSCSERQTKDGRDLARCQSMSLPPVRPTRTRDDSKQDLMRDDSTNPDLMKEDSNTDLLKDDSKAVTCSDNSDRTNETTAADKDEIDPDMYVRLLRGQSPLPSAGVSATSLSPPILASVRSGGCQAITTKATDPPKKPRRSYTDQRSDERCKHSSPSRYKNLIASANRDNTCPPQKSRCQSFRGDSCSHAVSPKPPAKPSRTIDDAILEGAAGIPDAPNNDSTDLLLAPPLLSPMTPRVSEDTASLLEDKKMTSRNTDDQPSSHEQRQNPRGQLEMSSSNRMDLEQADDEKEKDEEEEEEEDEETEILLAEDGVEEEEETEVSIPASMKEYDPDLFARLLNGESCSEDAAIIGIQGRGGDANKVKGLFNAEEANSNSRVSRGVAPTLSAYNRFDNSASCAMPEHMEGAMKSSHPPMRPRRSFDEGMMVRKDNTTNAAAAVSLASAAAVACVAGACSTPPTSTTNTSLSTAITAVQESSAATYAAATNNNKRRICIIGGKRCYYRPSRRATLALASELPPSSENANTVVSAVRNPAASTTGGGAAAVSFLDESPNYFTMQEASSFAIGPTLYHPESSFGGGGGFTEIDEREEYVQRVDPIAVSVHHLHHQQSSDDHHGSYQRILPARRHRRVVRRFTMPSKGTAGEEIMTSPQTKKRRTIGRSLSCRPPSTTQNGATPAA